MSIYYIVVNKTKKEYFNLGEIGYGISEYNYKFFGSRLLGYLMMSEFEHNNEGQFNPSLINTQDGVNMGYGEFFFNGHWANDTVILASEFTKEYDIIRMQEHFPSRLDEEKWVDISIPLRDEWNSEVKSWFSGNDDEEEEQIKELLI